MKENNNPITLRLCIFLEIVIEKAIMSSPTRLDLFLSHAGFCSRRKANDLIKKGEITINHWPVTDPCYELQPKDTVRYLKQVITAQPTDEPVYVLLYKPAGYVTTASDDKNRRTIFSLIGDGKFKSRLFPIGRLDINTTGILLITNDGHVTHKLAHPRYEVEKVYQVILDKPLSQESYKAIKHGLHLKDGPISVDKLEIGYTPSSVRITIHSGRNRIVRRIFESQGYTVTKLERIGFAGLTKRGLALGQWRFLNKREIASIKKLAADK